jgi:hypothetical protein
MSMVSGLVPLDMFVRTVPGRTALQRIPSSLKRQAVCLVAPSWGGCVSLDFDFEFGI